MIIRFPKEIAEKIRDAFANNQKMPITIEPKIGKGLEFDVAIKDLQYTDKGVLVDLPTITESYKSRDYINLYKSNDIS
jgi:transcription initiation factor TFIID subunit 7